MRPLTFGVLTSAPSGTGTVRPTPGIRHIEAQADLRSAMDVQAALRALGHDAVCLAADADLDLLLRQHRVDACILALHGNMGGSGDVQALLSVRGVPFFGPRGNAVATSFDKVRARQFLGYHNLPVPASLVLGAQRRTDDRALELLGWPCFVKPRRGAHGLGVALLEDPTQVEEALGRALDLDEDVVLERAVAGAEVQVVLFGTRVLGSTEVLSHRTDDGVDGFVCPPRMSRGRLDGVHNLARRAVGALGLESGISRVDIIVSERHNETILEVEPLPSLARDGVVARVANTIGISYEELISSIIDHTPLRPSMPNFEGAHALLQ